MACNCKECKCTYKCSVDLSMGILYNTCILDIPIKTAPDKPRYCPSSIHLKEKCKFWIKVDNCEK